MASSTRQLYTGKLTVATATPTVGIRLPTFEASTDLPEANQTAIGTLVWLVNDKKLQLLKPGSGGNEWTDS